RATVVLRRAVDVDLGAGPVDGDEERQALHVVPVEVRDQRVAPEAAVGGLGGAQEAEPGAEVEDDRLVARLLDGDARRVAAVALVRLARARCRPADAEEGHVQTASPPEWAVPRSSPEPYPP